MVTEENTKMLTFHYKCSNCQGNFTAQGLKGQLEHFVHLQHVCEAGEDEMTYGVGKLIKITEIK